MFGAEASASHCVIMQEDVLEATIKKALTNAPSSFSFIWQGGEPLLAGLSFYEKAVELQKKYGAGINISNAIQTNATLLNEDWISFFKKNDFLVGVSLDGAEHVHNAYRKDADGEGTWNIVSMNAKTCAQAGVATNILSCVTSYSVKYPDETYRYLTGEGFSYLQFIPVIEKDLRGQATAFSVSPKAYGNFLCCIFDCWYNEFRDGRPITSVRQFETLFFTLLGHTGIECGIQKKCGSYLAIEHNGDVFPCDFFVEPAHKSGNVLQDDLRLLFNGKMQRLFGGAKAHVSPKCKKCKWLAFCNGGCLKDRKNNPNGFEQNYFCASMKIFLPYAIPKLKELAARWQGSV